MPQRIEHPSRPQSPLTPHRTCILAFLVHNSSISLLANCIAVQTRKEYFTSRVELVGLAVATLASFGVGHWTGLPHGHLFFKSDRRQFRCLELLPRGQVFSNQPSASD